MKLFMRRLKKKKTRTLRSKILITIFFLVGTTLFSTLYYSYGLISNDKKGYIYEDSLRRADLLSNQLKSELISYELLARMAHERNEESLEKIKSISKKNATNTF